MNLDADYIQRTFDLLSLVERDTHLRKIGANWYAGPCPFCGGTDRFVLKQTADGWRWLCRHCTDGQYQDAIDYIQRRDGLDFKEALERLGGGKPSPLRAEPERTAEPEPQGQTQETRERLKQIAFDASRRIDLDDDPLAQTVRNYLYGRGFIRPTLQFAMLGAAEVYDPKAGRKRPAASIPYFNSRLDVRAVKFRFVDGASDGLRYIAAKGSMNDLYWLPEEVGRFERLLVVEGELNYLSLAQTLPELDLISTGSQALTAEMQDVLQKVSRRYRRVFVWLDDGDRSAKLALLLRGKAFKSPLMDGQKWDANRLLQADMLNEFVEKAFSVPCHGWRLSDWRAQYEPQGVMHG